MTVRLYTIAGEGRSQVHLSGDRAGARLTVALNAFDAMGQPLYSASTLLTRSALREMWEALGEILGERGAP